MKKALLFAAAITIVGTACKKKGDDTVFNQWTANGATRVASTVYRAPIAYSITASDDGPGTGPSAVTFIFNRAPKTGAYKVVDFAGASDEVNIIYNNSSTIDIYRSNTADTRKVDVRVLNDKWTVWFDRGITLQPVLPGGRPVELKGAITER